MSQVWDWKLSTKKAEIAKGDRLVYSSHWGLPVEVLGECQTHYVLRSFPPAVLNRAGAGYVESFGLESDHQREDRFRKLKSNPIFGYI